MANWPTARSSVPSAPLSTTASTATADTLSVSSAKRPRVCV